MLLRLFVVGGEHIALAMVVEGHVCTQNTYLIRVAMATWLLTSMSFIACIACDL